MDHYQQGTLAKSLNQPSSEVVPILKTSMRSNSECLEQRKDAKGVAIVNGSKKHKISFKKKISEVIEGIQ